jgi:hypothetical protein
MVFASGGLSLEEKKLPKNKYFDEELLVYTPAFLGKEILGMSFNSGGGITALATSGHKLSLQHYTVDNHLQQTVDCMIDSEMSPPTQLSEMLYRNGFYYTYLDTYFLKIAEDGRAQGVDVNAQIGLFAASTQYAKFRIALSTDEGCILLRQIGGELKAGSNFFAQDITPVDIKFMSSNSLVIAGKYKVAVYDINEDSVSVVRMLETQSAVVALLPTANRRQFAYMDEKGQIFASSIEGE